MHEQDYAGSPIGNMKDKQGIVCGKLGKGVFVASGSIVSEEASLGSRISGAVRRMLAKGNQKLEPGVLLTENHEKDHDRLLTGPLDQ